MSPPRTIRAGVIRQAGDPVQKPQPQRVRVLFVLHSDGFVEAFGEKHVDVHIENVLATAPEQETLAEHYLDLRLPKQFEGLHCPGKLRAVGQVEHLTAEDELGRRAEVDLIRDLAEIRRGNE